METKTKQKQSFLTRIFWLELGINFIVLAVLLIWAFSDTSPGSQARRESIPAPMVLGAFSESLRGEQVAPVQNHFISAGQPDLAGISAKSFLVFNAEDGAVLLEKNADQKLGIASLTKLLTAYVAYQKLDMAAEIKIGPNFSPGIKPSLGLVPGDTVKLLDLFNGMLVGSENDAAEALAQSLQAKTGQNVASLMNETAGSLGMNDSHFGNPYGFDFGNNYSTANDLKKLIMATQSLHAFKSLEKNTGYSFNGQMGSRYYAKATNRLIGSHANIYAIKTGYTETALGSIALKTIIEDKPVVIVVVGSQNREKDALKLIEEVNKHFKLGP